LKRDQWEDLVYGWGNESFSALPEYLDAVAAYGRSATGPVLECGSGLTTLVLAAVGADVWTLEHDEQWFRTVRDQLQRLGMGVHLRLAPLRNYGQFDWYDVEPEQFPVFSLVVCDGPPGDTRGGRYGLLSVLEDRLVGGCVVLLDDADRPGERDIVTAWGERVRSFDLRGTAKPYAVAVLT
jgi:hypothetical protein